MATIAEMLSAAQKHLDEEHFEDAMALLEVAYRRAPRSGRVLKLYGVCLLAADETERGLNLLKSAHFILPDDVEVCHDLALAYMANNEPQSGVALLEKAISIDPDNAKIHTSFASFLAQTGDINNAIKHAVAAARLSPDDADLQVTLGQIIASTGSLFDAHTAFRRALEIDPEHADAKQQLSKVLLDLNQFDEALDLAEESYLSTPRDPVALSNYAAALARTGQVKEALSHIEKAIAIAPYLPETMEIYALISAYSGAPEKGLAHVAKEIKRNREAVAFQLILAEVLAYNGRQREAIEVATPFLIDPSVSNVASTIIKHCLSLIGDFERLRELDIAQKTGNLMGFIGIASETSDPAETSEENEGDGHDGNEAANPPSNPHPAPPAVRDLNHPDGEVDGILINYEMKPLDALVLTRFVADRLQAKEPELVESEADIRLDRDQAFDTKNAQKILAPKDLFPALSRIVSADRLVDVDTLSDMPDGFTFQYLSDYGLGTAVEDYSPSTFEPYVNVDDAYDALWDNALAPFKRPFVGICWSQFEPKPTLADIAELLRGFEGTVFSLVWDDLRMELDAYPEFIDVGMHLRSIDALIDVAAKMDAIVAADTMPLHYAGALGIPGVGLITPEKPWYWHVSNGKSYWYPSLHILERDWASDWPSLKASFDLALQQALKTEH